MAFFGGDPPLRSFAIFLCVCVSSDWPSPVSRPTRPSLDKTTGRRGGERGEGRAVGLRSYRATSQPLSTLTGALVAPARPISRYNLSQRSRFSSASLARSSARARETVCCVWKKKKSRSVGRASARGLPSRRGRARSPEKSNLTPSHSTPSLPWKCQKISRVSEARKDGAKVQGGVQGG